MELNLQTYTPSSRDLEWARKYKQDLKKRGDARKQKNQYALFMWVIDFYVMVKIRTAVIYHVRARIFDKSRAESPLNGFKNVPEYFISVGLLNNAFFFLKRLDW